MKKDIVIIVDKNRRQDLISCYEINNKSKKFFVNLNK